MRVTMVYQGIGGEVIVSNCNERGHCKLQEVRFIKDLTYKHNL